MKFLLIFINLVAFVIAKSATCIAQDLANVQQLMLRLQCSLDQFCPCDEPRSNGIIRDFKPLIQVYKKNAEVDSALQELVDDIQCSRGFNSEDSEKILEAFASLEKPLSETLDSFGSKYCCFTNALGPFLTHRVVGSNIRNTRCLVMQVFKSLGCKIDTEFREILQSVGSEVDSQFQAVICKY